MVVDCGDTPASAAALLEDPGASTGRPATLLRRQAGLTPRLIGLAREGGEAVIAQTRVDGRICLKLTLLNPRATLEDVTVVLAAVKRTGKQLSGREES